MVAGSIWVWVKINPCFHLPGFHFGVTLCLTHGHLAMGQNSVPPVNIPIPTKIPTKTGIHPKMGSHWF